MLNKKAQIEDNLEIVLSIIGIIIGVVIITLAKAEYKISVDHAENAIQSGSTIESFDAKFIGTDLLNILKLETGDYTFGELIAYMPRNYQEVQDPALFEDLFWDVWLVNGLGCDTELYKQLDENLRPIYGANWALEVVYKDEQIFTCPYSYLLYPGYSETNMFLPSLDPNEELLVSLNVNP